MRLSPLPFVLAALAVASTAAAHSWMFASVVGTIKPGTVQCDEKRCTATLHTERLQLHHGDVHRSEAEVKMTFLASTALGDRVQSERWPDARTALLAIGDSPVRVRGEFDWIDGQGELTVERLVRMTPGIAGAPAAPEVFPACGRPPWSQATLARCFSVAGRERAVTVKATLAIDADAEASLRGNGAPAWLDLEGISVSEMGIALAAPSTMHETAIVGAEKRVVRATARSLRAGDRLTLEGAYVLPVPGNLKGIEGAQCSMDRCWPQLVVESVGVSARR